MGMSSDQALFSQRNQRLTLGENLEVGIMPLGQQAAQSAAERITSSRG